MSVLRCAYGTRVSATREGAERIDESCELRKSWSRCFYFRFHNVTIIPTFGSARGATGTAAPVRGPRRMPRRRRHGRRCVGHHRSTDWKCGDCAIFM